MTVNNMREAILKVYSGVRWKRKVASMSDGQVIAVYTNFERRGLFTKLDIQPKKNPFEELTKEYSGGKQMTIDDLLKQS